MSKGTEDRREVNERTRLCKTNDDDSLGSRTSVVTTSSEKQQLEDSLRGGRRNTPPRQPPPVRRVIPKPFRRQKQSFDYGDGDQLRRTEEAGNKHKDPLSECGDTNRDEDNEFEDKVHSDENKDTEGEKERKPVDNGSVRVSESSATTDPAGDSAQRRRVGGGSGIRDRSKYIYMRDSSEGRQFSRGEFLVKPLNFCVCSRFGLGSNFAPRIHFAFRKPCHH